MRVLWKTRIRFVNGERQVQGAKVPYPDKMERVMSERVSSIKPNVARTIRCGCPLTGAAKSFPATTCVWGGNSSESSMFLVVYRETLFNQTISGQRACRHSTNGRSCMARAIHRGHQASRQASGRYIESLWRQQSVASWDRSGQKSRDGSQLTQKSSTRLHDSCGRPVLIAVHTYAHLHTFMHACSDTQK